MRARACVQLTATANKAACSGTIAIDAFGVARKVAEYIAGALSIVRNTGLRLKYALTSGHIAAV